MRIGWLCLCVGCSFETKLAPSGNLQPPDATRPAPDAPTTTAMPDAPPVKVCAPAYAALPAAGTTSKYRRVQVQTPWLTAKADCEADGGHLVIPETEAEAKAVFALVDPLETSPYYWAGISDVNQDGQWITVTGQPFTNLAWGPGDPDEREGEIYALVYSDGTFYDWFDDGEQEYACECPP